MKKMYKDRDISGLAEATSLIVQKSGKVRGQVKIIFIVFLLITICHKGGLCATKNVPI